MYYIHNIMYLRKETSWLFLVIPHSINLFMYCEITWNYVEITCAHDSQSVVSSMIYILSLS